MINRIIRIVSVVFLLFVICSLSVFFGTKIQRGEVSVAKSDQQTYYVAHTMFSPDPVLAAADYICDGVDDDVEIQQAVDALPATGGKIFIYAGDYHLSNAISRSIDNIWIEGAGKGTYLAYNASTPVINAGARNAWIISNLRTDVGGVYVSLATQCILQNVWIDTTLIAYRTQGYTISDSGDLTTKTYVDGKVPATMPSAFVASSGGAGDSGKGVLLNGSGKVDSSMISSTFSDNTTGVGATNYIVKWTGTSTQGSATNTDSQVSSAVSASHTQGADTALGSLSTKNSPVDADKTIYRNSESGDALVTSTWTQIKAFLKSYFDGIYGTGTDNTTGVGVNTYLVKWTSASTQSSATNTDAQVSAAVSASHTINTDTHLGIQDADLNMGTKNITNVGNVDGKDVSGLATAAEAVTAAKSDSDIADAINKKHAAGTDTALGTQSEDLNMGTFAITSVGNVDGKDVSGLATAAESVTAAKADGDISDAISKKHAQGTDTTLGTMTANINMGGDNITNVGFVDGVDISSISTHTQGTDTALGTVGTKNPPVDADKVVYRNSESSDVLVTATWTQVKAFLKAYFDGVYKTGTDNITGAGASGYMTKWSDEDTLVAGTNTDTDVADAVSKRHSSGSDTALGTQLEDLNMGTFAITSVGNVDGKDVSSLATAAEAVTAAKLDADISDAISKKHSAGSDTSLGTQVANLNMGGDNITNVGFVDGKDVSSLVTSADAVTAAKADGDISDAISKKHSAGSDTSLGTQIANLDMGTENITNVGYVDGVDVSTLTTSGIEFVIDGGGAAITTGEKGDIEIPFVCTITKVTMLADQSGSIAVDIWKDSYANYPPTDADSITASAVPTITTAVKSQDDTLTGWTKTVAAGSIIRYNVDSCDTITRVTISLTVTR